MGILMAFEMVKMLVSLSDHLMGVMMDHLMDVMMGNVTKI